MREESKVLLDNLLTTRKNLQEIKKKDSEIYHLKSQLKEKIERKNESCKNRILELEKEREANVQENNHIYSEKIQEVQKRIEEISTQMQDCIKAEAKRMVRPLEEKVENIESELRGSFTRWSSIKSLRKIRIKKYTLYPEDFKEWLFYYIISMVIGTLLSLFNYGFSRLIFTALLVIIPALRLIYYVASKKANKLRNEIHLLTLESENKLNYFINNPDLNIPEINKYKEQLYLQQNILAEIYKQQAEIKAELLTNYQDKLKELELSLGIELEQYKVELESDVQNIICEINREKKMYEDFLDSECRVSSEYQIEETLDRLISFIKNERASNLKEAIELFNESVRQENKEREALERLKLEREYKQREFQLQERQIEGELSLKVATQNKELDLIREKLNQEREKMAYDFALQQEKINRELEIKKEELEHKKYATDIARHTKEQEILVQQKSLDLQHESNYMLLKHQEKMHVDKLSLEQRRLFNEERMLDIDMKEYDNNLKRIDLMIKVINEDQSISEREREEEITKLKRKKAKLLEPLLEIS